MQKYLKLSTIFTRGPSWMYDRVLNTPSEGFVQDAPREKLATSPVAECLTTTDWQNYHQQISSKQDQGHFA